MKVNLEAEQVEISYDGNAVSLEEIADTIEDQGYDVVK